MISCPNCKAQFEVKIVLATTPPPKSRHDDPDDIASLLSQVNDDTLTPWEANFIGDLRKRSAQYGGKVLMSDKQLTTLQKIVEKGF